MVHESSHYCICGGIKNEKPFQYTNEHCVPEMFNPNITTPWTFTKFCIFPKPTSASIAKNLEIKKTYVQKAIKKQEAMNLIPAKTKGPISKTSTEPLHSLSKTIKM